MDTGWCHSEVRMYSSHVVADGKRAKDEWRKSQAKVREGGGMLNDVGRQELL